MAPNRNSFVRGLFIAGLLIISTAAFAAVTIDQVAWSQSQFNPTIGARAAVTFSLNERARVSARVVDLNGRIIRNLISKTELEAGKNELSWDGRDDDGRLVPDGAYQPVVEAAKRRERVSHATPFLRSATVIPVRYYDRRTGTIAYDLPSASLVRIVANAQTADGGSAVRVVAAEAARPAGAVIEPWDGRDDSGEVRIPDLPGFTIRIEAVPLPADAVITYGGRNALSAAVATTDAARDTSDLPLTERGDR